MPQGTGYGLNQANTQAQGVFDQFMNPNNMLSRFQQMGMMQAPSMSDFLGIMAARQGSGLQAQEAFEGAQRQGSNQGFEAFNRFLMGSQSNALGALGELQQNARMQEELRFRDKLDRRQGRRSLINNIVGGGLGALGLFLGGGMFRQQPGGMGGGYGGTGTQLPNPFSQG